MIFLPFTLTRTEAAVVDRGLGRLVFTTHPRDPQYEVALLLRNRLRLEAEQATQKEAHRP